MTFCKKFGETVVAAGDAACVAAAVTAGITSPVFNGSPVASDCGRAMLSPL